MGSHIFLLFKCCAAVKQVNVTGSASVLCPEYATYCRTRLQLTPASAFQVCIALGVIPLVRLSNSMHVCVASIRRVPYGAILPLTSRRHGTLHLYSSWATRRTRMNSTRKNNHSPQVHSSSFISSCLVISLFVHVGLFSATRGYLI